MNQHYYQSNVLQVYSGQFNDFWAKRPTERKSVQKEERETHKYTQTK